MTGDLLIVTPNGPGERRHFTGPLDLSVLKGAVGGHIEVVPYFNTIEIDGGLRDCVAFCNEDGKGHLALPANKPATVMWQHALQRRKVEPRTLLRSAAQGGGLADYLVGNIAIVWGDKHFMASL
jgi:hypothetical protein